MFFDELSLSGAITLVRRMTLFEEYILMSLSILKVIIKS